MPTIPMMMFAFSVAVPLSQSSQPAVEPLTPAEAARFAELDAKGFKDYSNAEVGEYLGLRYRQAQTQEGSVPPPPDLIGALATRSLGQTFRLNAYRFDMAEVDCVVFAERTLALSLAKDWESYRLICDRLRHKDGVVDYKQRNFGMLDDWIPNNAWLLRDITPSLPGAENFQYKIRPKVFQEEDAAPGSKFKKIHFVGHDWHSSDVQVKDEFYIPSDKVEAILPELKTGDVCVIVIGIGEGRRPGSDHMGIIVRQPNGEVALAQGAIPASRVQSLRIFLRQNTDRVSGLKFLRLRDDMAQSTASEVNHMQGTVAIPSPSNEDTRVAKLRDRRSLPEVQ